MSFFDLMVAGFALAIGASGFMMLLAGLQSALEWIGERLEAVQDDLADKAREARALESRKQAQNR